MRLVLQRVKEAQVKIQGSVVGEIGPGLLLFLGVGQRDSTGDVDYLVEKVLHLRIFADERSRFNRSLRTLGDRCWWYPSLLFSGTAGKAGVLPFPGPPRRRLPNPFTGILSEGWSKPA